MATKATKSAAAKTAKKTTTRKTTARKTTARKQKVTVQEFLELARQEAYLVFENRSKKGLPGDSTSDWVEAEKNLKAKYEVIE